MGAAAAAPFIFPSVNDTSLDSITSVRSRSFAPSEKDKVLAE
jgi:hypothetical protein